MILSRRSRHIIVFTIILLLIVWGLTYAWLSDYLVEQRKMEVRNELFIQANSISSALNRRYQAVDSLSAFIDVTLTNDNFSSQIFFFLQTLYQNIDDAYAVSAIKQDGLVYVVPNAVNVSLQYHAFDHSEIPELTAVAMHALATERVEMSLPYRIGNNFAVSLYKPIYHEGELWGYAALTTNIDNVLRRGNLLEPDDDMLYALTNDDREPFFGEPLVGFADRIAHQFEIDRRIWILSATPRDGWGSLIRGQMSLFVVIYAGVSAMILIIVLLALQRADWLEQRVVHKELEAQLAGQRERQHLARELHDSISQILYAIGLSARTLESHAEGEAISSQDVGDIAATISELAEGSLSELRTLILGLHPEVFARIGLNGALEQLAEAIQNRHQIHVELSIISEPDIGLNEKMALFRIAQEAAQNAIKHAQPNLISLTTRHRENGKFTLQIADTGIGFEVNEDFPGHLGLQSMQERAQIIGARFTIRSRLKEGTRITIELS